jgi:uncharacterized protein
MPLAKLFGKETRFWTLLRNAAAQAKISVASLLKLVPLLGAGPTETTMGDIGQSRRKAKQIATETTEALTKVFNTPLDREDIEALNSALYKISKTVEKIAERLTICPPGANFEHITKQLGMLEQAVAVTELLVDELCGGQHGEKVKEHYERLQAIESSADRVMTEQLRELSRGNEDARSLVYWKDMLELAEKAIDRCRDAGDIVFTTILKNS